jgi:hypothetical protein
MKWEYVAIFRRVATARLMGLAEQPLAFHLSCPHLTVASLLFMNISFLAPPALVILSVTGYVLQQFTIDCAYITIPL